jgi:hypothetical protein
MYMLKLGILIGVLILPLRASGQGCKRMAFTGTVRSGMEYSHPITSNLAFRLAPLKDDWGWVISVRPDNKDEDWTYPVSLPLTGERQLVGTGYGTTVRQRITWPSIVYFVLSRTDFVRYSQMANEAMSGPGAPEFIHKVDDLSKGRITLRVLKHENGPSNETIHWIAFRVEVIVPRSFLSPRSTWTPASCPAPN